MSNALPAPDPSMDEILASIKRIIESGDEKIVRRAPVGGGADVEAPPPLPAGLAGAPGPATEDLPRPAAGDRGAAWWQPQRPLGPTDQDEISASHPGNALDSEGDALRRPGAVAETRFDEDAFETELVGMISDGDDRADADIVGSRQDDDIDGSARFAAANSDEAGLRRSSPAGLDEPPIVAERSLAEPATHRIISQEAGARVAASFEDLSRAIREDQMRSVEDAVQDMLRPMLQEWLDDNLPRLVERLVREEIERVATGGRR